MEGYGQLPESRAAPLPVRTYGGDRVCAHEGCRRRLSTYNPLHFCWAHRDEIWQAPEHDPRLERVCLRCGHLKPLTTAHWYRSRRRGFWGWNHYCKQCKKAMDCESRRQHPLNGRALCPGCGRWIHRKTQVWGRSHGVWDPRCRRCT